MTKNQLAIPGALFFLVLSSALPAWGQSFAKVKTVAGGLRVTTGIRALGLGATGAATTGDPTNLSLNPAAIVGVDHVAMSVASLEGLDLSSVKNVQLSGAFPVGTVRVGLALGYTSRDIRNTTVVLPDTNVTSSRDDDQVTAALAASLRLLFVHVSGGLTSKWVRIRDDGLRIKEDVQGYDVGAIGWIPIQLGEFNRITPSVGVSGLNIGESDVFEVPTTVRYGFRVRYESWSFNPMPDVFDPEIPFFALSVNSDTIQPEYGEDEPWEHGLGVEMSLAEVVHLRVGFRDDNEREDRVQTAGLGVGIRTDTISFRVDGAWTENAKAAGGFIVGFVF